MTLDNIIVKFQGVSISSSFGKYVKEKIYQLYQDTPSQTTCKIVFTKKDHTYKGLFTEGSLGKRSIAIVHGSRIEEVAHKLLRTIRKKVKRKNPPKFHQKTYRNIYFNHNEQRREAV